MIDERVLKDLIDAIQKHNIHLVLPVKDSKTEYSMGPRDTKRLIELGVWALQHAIPAMRSDPVNLDIELYNALKVLPKEES